jgi:hypothetical protein
MNSPWERFYRVNRLSQRGIRLPIFLQDPEQIFWALQDWDACCRDPARGSLEPLPLLHSQRLISEQILRKGEAP